MQGRVLAEGRLAVEVGPLDMVDVRQRHAGLAVHLGQAAVVGLGVVRDGVARHLHDLPADVDDVAALRRAPGGLDVDAQNAALDRLAHPFHGVGVAVAADGARDDAGAATLQLADARAGVLVGQRAREQRARQVAQADLADLVAQLAVAVGELEDHVEREARLVVRAPFVEKRLDGLLAALALGFHRVVVAVDEHGDEGLHGVLKCLIDVHARHLPIS